MVEARRKVCYRQLCVGGIGAAVKHTTIITPEEKSRLWEAKVIGDHSPLALLRAVFWSGYIKQKALIQLIDVLIGTSGSV